MKIYLALVLIIAVLLRAACQAAPASCPAPSPVSTPVPSPVATAPMVTWTTSLPPASIDTSVKEVDFVLRGESIHWSCEMHVVGSSGVFYEGNTLRFKADNTCTYALTYKTDSPTFKVEKKLSYAFEYTDGSWGITNQVDKPEQYNRTITKTEHIDGLVDETLVMHVTVILDGKKESFDMKNIAQ